MSTLSSIRSAIARHGADLSALAPLAPTDDGAGAPHLPFPTDRHAAAAATPALTAALAAAPGSVSGGASGGMSGGVLGAIPSPRPVSRRTAGADTVLDALAGARAAEHLDWRHSPTDLLTLLELDASPAALRQLADELGCGEAADLSDAVNARLRGHLAIPHAPAPPLRRAS